MGIRLAILAISIAALISGAASAQDFPSRRFTIVVPFPPGGATEIAIRSFAEKLTQRTNQPVLVEPKPGGATVIGASAVLQAPADGYTLFFTGAQGYVPEFFSTPLPFDFLRDFQAIAIVGQYPLGVTINREFGARSVKELIDLAKSNPAKCNVGSATPVMGVASGLFMREAGINCAIVTYKGGNEGERALLGNEIQWMLTGLQPHYRENAASAKARVVAVAGSKRHPDWPDIPTTGEVGFPNFILESIISLHVSSKTPPAIVQRLSQEANAILAMPDIQQRYRQAYGWMVIPMSASAAQQQIADMYKRWADAVKVVGYKPQP